MDQFLKLNFIGPSKQEKSSFDDLEKLKIDGLAPNKLIQGAHYLVEALKNPASPLENARALVLQQSVLSGPSPTLKAQIFDQYKDGKGPHVALEKARAHLIYNELQETQECLIEAQKAQNFTWAVTGVFGKRTKFQERDATQLVALAKSSSIEAPKEKHPEDNIPSREHNSETLLEQPIFTGDLPVEFNGLDANTPTALNDLDVALMLLQAEYLLRANPANDAATNEQVLAISERIILAPKNSVDWLLHLRALWLRSCVESHFESRAIETLTRGTVQMADIVNALHQSEGPDRTKYAHLVMPLPKWSVDAELAKRLVQIGGVEASAEIYDRLGLPVDAAVCYSAGGQTDKALERINKALEDRPTDARAWSVKGDLTQDPECWIKSWESGRYVTAKISLGKYYQSKGEAATAAKHLEDAVGADSQNLDSQFTLGCIKLQLRDFEGAERAFSECIRIKPDEAKCWINLGAVRTHLGKLEQALVAFDRALQVDQNHEPNMRVWNNKMLLACELRKWQIVVDGYKYMLSSQFDQDVFINPSILTEMTAGFTMNEYTGDSLERSFAQLMCEKLPQGMPQEPNFWRLAATVSEWQNKPWDALKQYENGWQAVLEQPDNSANGFRKLAKWTTLLVDSYNRLGGVEGRIEGSKVCPEAPIKAKSAVRSALARGDAFKGTEDYERVSRLA